MRSPARTTAVPNRSPGRRVSRSTGPLTLTAAMTVPDPSRTGALTEAAPGSRSSTLSIHPARESGRPASTRPAEPTSIGSRLPSGTIHRNA